MRAKGSLFRPTRLWPFLAHLAGLAILGLLPVLPILIKGSPVLNNDMLLAYFCYFWDFHKNWAWSHPLVFWSSSFQCGMPMHAYWQSGYLYPITWLFFGPLSPLYGIYLFYAFHFSLGIFGFLKLGPHLHLHKPAALWAGICFSLSGTMLARYEHTTFLSGWTWMPVVLAAYFELRDRPRLRSLFLYSLAVAMQAFGGHPQASITTAILVGIFTLVDLIKGPSQNSNVIRSVTVTDAIPKSRRASWIICGHVLALVYCSPMLIPFLKLVGETSRFDGVALNAGLMANSGSMAADNSAAAKLEDGVFGFEKFSTGGMRPLHLLSLVAPNILGSPSNGSWWGGEVWGEVFVYLGGLGLFFCFFASWKRSSRNFRILWLVGLLGLWIAFGKHLGASQILYHIPVLNNFRRPARFVILFVMAIAALSGYGLQSWLARPKGRKWMGWFGAASFLVACALLSFQYFPMLLAKGLIVIGQFHPLDSSKDYGEKIRLLLSATGWDFVFLTVSGLAILFVARRPRALFSLLFVVLLGDLLRLHWDHFYLFPADYYRKPPETVRFLDKTTEPFWRVSHYLEYPGLEMWQMHNDPLAHFELLEREKSALSFGIHAIFSYRHVGAHLPLIWNWDPGLTAADKSTRYLFSNISLSTFAGDSVRLLGNIKGMNAYEFNNWKPRIEHLPVPAERTTAVCSDGFSGFQSVCVKEIKDGHMEIEGSFLAGDTVLIRERAYSGWRYRLDKGLWKPAIASPHHFLILPISKASKQVELDFFPADFYALSAACGLISLLIPVIVLLFRRRIGNRHTI